MYVNNSMNDKINMLKSQTDVCSMHCVVMLGYWPRCDALVCECVCVCVCVSTGTCTHSHTCNNFSPSVYTGTKSASLHLSKVNGLYHSCVPCPGDRSFLSYMYLWFKQLGGKNAAIVFNDADLDKCIATCIR